MFALRISRFQPLSRTPRVCSPCRERALYFAAKRSTTPEGVTEIVPGVVEIRCQLGQLRHEVLHLLPRNDCMAGSCRHHASMSILRLANHSHQRLTDGEFAPGAGIHGRFALLESILD